MRTACAPSGSAFAAKTTKPAHMHGLRVMGGTGLEPVTPSLSIRGGCLVVLGLVVGWLCCRLAGCDEAGFVGEDDGLDAVA